MYWIYELYSNHKHRGTHHRLVEYSDCGWLARCDSDVNNTYSLDSIRHSHRSPIRLRAS